MIVCRRLCCPTCTPWPHKQSLKTKKFYGVFSLNPKAVLNLRRYQECLPNVLSAVAKFCQIFALSLPKSGLINSKTQNQERTNISTVLTCPIQKQNATKKMLAENFHKKCKTFPKPVPSISKACWNTFAALWSVIKNGPQQPFCTPWASVLKVTRHAYGTFN